MGGEGGAQGSEFDGDLSSVVHCHKVVRRTVDELGSLNILVNNAALHVPQSDFLKITPAQLDETFRTNFFAYVRMAQAALPHLREGDCIINTGSVTGLRGHASLLDYAATKAAIHNFT